MKAGIIVHSLTGNTFSVVQMKAICESKKANVCKTGIVNWISAKKRESKISEVVNQLAATLVEP